MVFSCFFLVVICVISLYRDKFLICIILLVVSALIVDLNSVAVNLINVLE